jgi:hypothetical protein
MMKATTEQRRLVRAVAGAENNLDVDVVPGGEAPKAVGRYGYHTTPSGNTIVRHPHAYGWRTVYHCSSRRVEVGEDWLRDAAQHYDTIREDGITGVYDLRTFCRGPHGLTAVRATDGHWLIRDDDRAWHHRGEIDCGWARALDGWELRDTVTLHRQMDARRGVLCALGGMNPAAVPVTVAQSYRAGNCPEGTRQFARRHGLGAWASAQAIMRWASDAPDRIKAAVELAARECAETVAI